jgi:hypothetical protein
MLQYRSLPHVGDFNRISHFFAFGPSCTSIN